MNFHSAPLRRTSLRTLRRMAHRHGPTAPVDPARTERGKGEDPDAVPRLRSASGAAEVSPAVSLTAAARLLRKAAETRLQLKLTTVGGAVAWVCSNCSAVIFRPDTGGMAPALAAHYRTHRDRGDI